MYDDDERNRRCLVWEAVALTALVIVFGGCAALAVRLL
jgi:hypothetical protein